MTEAGILRVDCNHCTTETRHRLVTVRQRTISEPVGHGHSVDFYTFTEILECCGCEAVTVRIRERFSEWREGREDVTYYPPRVSRNPPVWIDRLDDDASRDLLKEIYVALHSDSRRLAVMGARAVLDRFIVDKVGDVGNFPSKLKELEEAGYVGARQRKILHAALDLGSATSHRGHLPTLQHVDGVMDIVENLLQVDLLHETAGELREETPPRGTS